MHMFMSRKLKSKTILACGTWHHDHYNPYCTVLSFAKMDKSRLIELKKCTTKIVNQASRPGGSLEKEEFTLGLARRLITEEMGLEAGDLDVGEWKTIVKGLVKKALVCLDEGRS